MAVLEAPVEGAIDNRAEHRPHRRRMLASVLFTDIVDSVSRAWNAGDRAWCDLLARHDRLVRSELECWTGLEIDSAGDGFFAAFDRPYELRGIPGGWPLYAAECAADA